MFADSGDAEGAVQAAGKQVGRLTKVLQDRNFLLSLSEDEEQRIKAIGDSRHVTRVSKVRVVGESTAAGLMELTEERM